MKVKVDAAKCQGNARCWTWAPNLFELNDEGYLDPGDVNVPEGEEENARRAVKSCPERALTLEE
ncbi:ferredoxin [Croceicoccus estronivorus]|uniref:ferredoxin n=1 Tax=Croceicoccus estronivorus TaxID=1172626 RepID=UPI00082F4FBE|nr:ferredoxin [Croceicoccus estronivorus]OCC23510.1 ferredoxin [Croceicoccus estronivorus]